MDLINITIPLKSTDEKLIAIEVFDLFFDSSKQCSYLQMV